MICRTAVVTSNLSFQTNWGTVLRDPFSEISVVANAAERGSARFSHLSAATVIAVVESVDAMQLI
jgi:hypothetical protein